MAKDYSKKCWSCGKSTMVSRGDCFQCSECGATWNPVPGTGIGALAAEPDKTTTAKKSIAADSGTPSWVVRQQAMKIRST